MLTKLTTGDQNYVEVDLLAHGINTCLLLKHKLIAVFTSVHKEDKKQGYFSPPAEGRSLQ